MKSATLFVGLAVALSIQGCTTLRYATLVDRISVDDKESVKSEVEARETLRMLQDKTAFPEAGIENVEVVENGIIIKSGERLTSVSGGYSYIPGYTYYTSSVNQSWSSTEKSTNQRTLWFRDVVGVYVTSDTIFNDNQRESGGGYETAARGYTVQIALKSQPSYSVMSKNELMAYRWASAIALVSKKDVERVPPLGPCGCIVDSEIGDVVVLRTDGPFAKAGIPIFTKIMSIDGEKIEPQDLSKALKFVTKGEHKIGTNVGALAAFFAGKVFTVKFD